MKEDDVADGFPAQFLEQRDILQLHLRQESANLLQSHLLDGRFDQVHADALRAVSFMNRKPAAPPDRFVLRVRVTADGSDQFRPFPGVDANRIAVVLILIGGREKPLLLHEHPPP